MRHSCWYHYSIYLSYSLVTSTQHIYCSWTPAISNWLNHIILWFQSYGCTFGECPNANALCAETLHIIPEDFLKSMINKEHDTDACTSYIPGCYSFVMPQCSSTRFRSIASSQGFEYILQEEEYEPVTENERSSYKQDLTFKYDAFQNSWADSMNFYLVKQNKPDLIWS